MISYELLEELKKAGYPNTWEDLCGHCGYGNGSNEPTLSELIDACGEGFKRLEKDDSIGWLAYYQEQKTNEERLKDGGLKMLVSSGKTKSEAVARLYIELKK